MEWLKMFLLFWLIFSPGIALDIAEMDEDLPVSISRGAHVHQLENVLIYSQTQSLFFMIPDLPDPAMISSSQCDVKDEEACALFHGLQNGVNDVNDLLALLNRILTTKGLADVNPVTTRIPDNWLKIIQDVNVPSRGPDQEAIMAAGEDWFSAVQARLTLRKFVENGTESLNKRQKRWLKSALNASIKIAKVLTQGDVSSVFQKLFVGDSEILSLLTNYKILTKDEFRVFAELPKRVSELQEETRKLFLDVLNSTELVKKTTDQLKDEISDHAYKIATVESSFLLEQKTLADIIRALYVSIVYSVHFDQYDECRSGKLPVAFLPPHLLHQRLLEVQNGLPDNIRLVIPLENFQQYYQLPLSKCIFDSSGGIIQLTVPLVEKSLHLEMFEFKAAQFQHEEFTCAIDTEASYVIKDTNQNRLYSITELDEDLCHPKTTGLCQLPLSSAEDSSNFCISVLLRSEASSTIKDACSLNCFKDSKPSISQISDDEFLGIHLAPGTARMECNNETLELKTHAPHGAVRFEAPCGCKVFLGKKLIGKSKSTQCQLHMKPKLNLVMPIQMTKFDDLMPYTNGADTTVFANAEEIYDGSFQPVVDLVVDDPVEEPFRYSTIFVNFVQSLTMLYLYYRLNGVTATVLALGNNFRLTEASKANTCELSGDVYALLWIILAVSVGSLLPAIFSRVYKALDNLHNERIQLAAQRYAMEA